MELYTRDYLSIEAWLQMVLTFLNKNVKSWRLLIKRINDMRFFSAFTLSISALFFNFSAHANKLGIEINLAPTSQDLWVLNGDLVSSEDVIQSRYWSNVVIKPVIYPAVHSYSVVATFDTDKAINFIIKNYSVPVESPQLCEVKIYRGYYSKWVAAIDTHGFCHTETVSTVNGRKILIVGDQESSDSVQEYLPNQNF